MNAEERRQHVRMVSAKALLQTQLEELEEARERHLRALELCAEQMNHAGLDASDAVRELHKAGWLSRPHTGEAQAGQPSQPSDVEALREAIRELTMTLYRMGLAEGSGSQVFADGKLYSMTDLVMTYKEQDETSARLLANLEAAFERLKGYERSVDAYMEASNKLKERVHVLEQELEDASQELERMGAYE
jgi:hypothetical protein